MTAGMVHYVSPKFQFENKPLGFQFLPKREELINFYLFKMLNNEALPPISSNVFTIAGVYATHPCTIFDACNENLKSEEIVEESDGVEKRIRYFFTPLKSFIKKDGNNGKRIKRKAGLGSWKEEFSDPIQVPHGGDVIGHERYFRYRVDKDKNEDDCIEWRMHEYSLVGNHDLAITRITKVIRKKRGRTSPAKIKIVLPMVEVINNLGFNNEQSFNNYGDDQSFTMEGTYNNVGDCDLLVNNTTTSVSKESISEVDAPPSTSVEWTVEQVMELFDFQV